MDLRTPQLTQLAQGLIRHGICIGAGRKSYKNLIHMQPGVNASQVVNLHFGDGCNDLLGYKLDLLWYTGKFL